MSIDRRMVKGCARPMGPLALADLAGRWQRLVTPGMLGRKSVVGVSDDAGAAVG